jgi:hypothetical protein
MIEIEYIHIQCCTLKENSFKNKVDHCLENIFNSIFDYKCEL